MISKGCVVGAVLAVLAVTSCASVPSQMVVRDRFDYGRSVAESWKRQTLMNVIRLRYADAPVFMDVTTLINTYSMTGSANLGAQLGSSTMPSTYPLGVGASFSNTPTVTYQPLNGERFVSAMLRPIPPAALFQMIQAGWSPRLIFSTAVRSINHLGNQGWGRPADPGFVEVVNILSTLRDSNNLGIRVEQRKDGDAVLVSLPVVQPSAPNSADAGRLRSLLGIDKDRRDLVLSFGSAQRDGTDLEVLTRSMLEILTEYGFGVDVPAADLSAGRAFDLSPSGAGSKPLTRLVHIRTGASAPEDAYAAVPYRNRWFWIEDADLQSKVCFTFVMILSSLAETGQVPMAPVITVPSR